MDKKLLLAVAIAMADLSPEDFKEARESLMADMQVLIPLKAAMRLLSTARPTKLVLSATSCVEEVKHVTATLEKLQLMAYTQANCNIFINEAIAIASTKVPTYTKFSSKDRREVIIAALNSKEEDPFALLKNSDRATRDSILYQMAFYRKAGFRIVALPQDLEKLPPSLVKLIERMILF